MNKNAIGYCGINCAECEVFQATAVDSDDLRRKCAESPVWQDTASQHWGIAKLDFAMMNCNGCHSEGDNIFLSCAKCPIRQCARNKKYASCGDCADWQNCSLLAGLLADVPEARKNLSG